MEKLQPGSSQVDASDAIQSKEQYQQKLKEQKPLITKTKSATNSPTHSQLSNESKHSKQSRTSNQQKQPKPQTSLENISIQSPMKKTLSKNQPKFSEKTGISQTKIGEKAQKYETELKSKAVSESYLKSTTKSIHHKPKKTNKPFYEQTFYITGMKQNYLLLLSDTNQVLEFPIGMFTTQGETNQASDDQEDTRSNRNDRFHLIKDIKIGQPIKIKLELDFMRQEKDDKIFHSLQKTIHEEYSSENHGEPIEQRGSKDIILPRSVSK